MHPTNQFLPLRRSAAWPRQKVSGDLGERSILDTLFFWSPVGLAYLGGLAQTITGILVHVPEAVTALRTTGAVPYASFGEDAREGQASTNRAAYVNQLAGEWLSRVPDIHARLLADRSPQVADVGCSADWASIALARGFPMIHVAELGRATHRGRTARLDERRPCIEVASGV